MLDTVGMNDKQMLRGEMLKIREAFRREDWTATLDAHERLREQLRRERALRLEATCLAVRALAAQKNRAAARALLETVVASTYSKSSHYEFIARAYLDLKQYNDVARVCQQAHAVREAETPK